VLVLVLVAVTVAVATLVTVIVATLITVLVAVLVAVQVAALLVVVVTVGAQEQAELYREGSVPQPAVRLEGKPVVAV
jgi:hypothetical protein